MIFGFKGDFEADEPHSDAMVIKLDDVGTEIWRMAYGGDKNDDFQYGEPLSDGSLIFSGSTRSLGGNDIDHGI